MAGGGNDVVDASLLAASAGVLLDGGDGDDVLVGSNGDDLLVGAAGDDVLVGGTGTDTLNGGPPGDNVLLGGEIVWDGRVPTRASLVGNTRTQDGNTLLDLGGRVVIVPGTSVEALLQGAAA